MLASTTTSSRSVKPAWLSGSNLISAFHNNTYASSCNFVILITRTVDGDTKVTQMSTTKKLKVGKLTWWGGLSLSLILAIGGTAYGVTSLSQGFITKDKTPLGAIVSLQKNTSDYVVSASPSNVGNILGVVVGQDNSLLSLSDGQSNQIQVATSGVVQVLVSDLNGAIKSGDPVTASPINGVGMKATSNTEIVGTAQDNLTGDHSSQQTYSDKSGHKHQVLLGEVPVLVNPSYYYKQPDKTIIPTAVQNVANALAGKTVNSLPVIISLAIFLITLIIIVSIIYSMIHSSIISVGRNPMSQAAIYRNLIQLSGLIVLILGVAVASIYMVLTKVS